MKRKFFSTLLMGAFVTASLSMMTSCKDYDDDINGLKSDIETVNGALTTAKTDLANQIATLKTQLEATNGDITALKAQVAAADAALTSAIGAEKTRAEAAEKALADRLTAAEAEAASLSARLTTAEDAIAKINEVLAGKVDQSVYDAAVKDIYAKLEAVENGLGDALKKIAALEEGLNNAEIAIKAAQEDIKQQKAAIEALQKSVADNLSLIKNNQTLIAQNKTAIEANAKAIEAINTRIDALQKSLQDQLDKVSGDVKVNAADIAQLKKDLQSLYDQVASLQAEVTNLNVLIVESLRSLVFIPQSYYWGVEATTLNFLSNNVYTLPAAAWNVKETKGYSDDSRYANTTGTKVLAFAATYHMNPSSAQIAKEGAVSVVSDDVPFVRAAACGISVTDYAAAGGILSVKLDVKDPTAVQKVHSLTATDPGDAITNFAVQVKLNKAGNDTTITSDYATLYTKEIKDLKLVHAAKTTANPIGLYAEAAKSALSPCTSTDPNSYGHLMQTVHEAGVTFDAQDFVVWNSTGIDLRKYVKVHYTDVTAGGDVHEVMDAATLAANFDIKFDLTAFYKGSNATDESAHAAIATDGYTLRPQAVDAEGKQLAYGGEQNQAMEVGRTPVVRVTLTDKVSGKVYDYGYIRFQIVNTPDQPVADAYISYTGVGYTYNGECTPAGWSIKTTWADTENDLYKATGLHRTDFVAVYGQDPEGSVSDLDQYVLKTDGTFQKLTTKIGVCSSTSDVSTDEDEVMSSTLKWEMTGAQALAFFQASKAGTGVAVKYKSNNAKYPDIYVLFKTGTPYTYNAPSATVAFNPNTTVWSKTNGSTTGVETKADCEEVHVNVLNPENNAGVTDCSNFSKVISEIFVGNKVGNVFTITDKTASQDYAYSKLTLDYQFDAANNGKNFKGLSGKTYVMSVSTDGKTLQAALTTSPLSKQAVAVISTGLIDAQKITYQNLEYAKDLLNVVAHDKLDNNTLTAIVGVYAKACKPLPLTNNTFNVRFLRPVNVSTLGKDIEDAGNAEQKINLNNLINYTDWRDLWGSATKTAAQYVTFYGVQNVTIDGVSNGQKISINSNVKTNQDGHTTPVPLSSVNGAIDFVYHTATTGNYLTYDNYNTTTGDFYVTIPVIAHYTWGDVPQTITVNVKRTLNNAKKN